MARVKRAFWLAQGSLRLKYRRTNGRNELISSARKSSSSTEIFKHISDFVQDNRYQNNVYDK